jgi:hypothetical protein
MFRYMRLALILSVFLSLLSACSSASEAIIDTAPQAPQAMIRPTNTAVANARLLSPDEFDPRSLAPVAERIALVEHQLSQANPILALAGLPEREAEAQRIALANERVQYLARIGNDPNQPEPLLLEVFGVYPLQPSDITPMTTACRESSCYRVELYDWARNQTNNVIIEMGSGTLLAINEYSNTAPSIVPEHLTSLATEIAVAAPAVREELGLEPSEQMVHQPEMKSSVSRCERSQHLCIVPTFVWGDRVLWALVDLTVYRLIGLEWTDVGASSKRAVSEQRLGDAAINEQFCKELTELERDGWQLGYMLTTSDGLAVSNVRYQGQAVASSLKLVDIQVAYTPSETTGDLVGYADAVGCPTFSTAAVLPWSPPTIYPIEGTAGRSGFALEQEYRSDLWPIACNYSYRQRFEFYNDGSFRVVVGSIGRGCGNNGTYRPILRMAFSDDSYSFAEWDGNEWLPWQTEAWQLQTAETQYSPEGLQYRLLKADGSGYAIEPSRGQFGNESRGDNAYLYLTRHSPDRDEGDSDLPTLGACCREDEKQGPERFIDDPPEALTGDSGLVVWYVPQLKNSDEPGSQYCWADSELRNGVFEQVVWPCYGGPLFVPIQAGE